MATPPVSTSWNTKRGVASMGLKPITEIKRPNMPPMSPLSTEPEVSPAMTVMPKMAIQNISEGPNFHGHLGQGRGEQDHDDHAEDAAPPVKR